MSEKPATDERRRMTIAELRDRYEFVMRSAQKRDPHQQPSREPETLDGEPLEISGKVMVFTGYGPVSFMSLQDGTGELQVCVTLHYVGEPAFTEYRAKVVRGAEVTVVGRACITRTKALALLASTLAWKVAA